MVVSFIQSFWAYRCYPVNDMLDLKTKRVVSCHLVVLHLVARCRSASQWTIYEQAGFSDSQMPLHKQWEAVCLCNKCNTYKRWQRWFYVLILGDFCWFVHALSESNLQSCLNTGLHRIGELNHPSVPRVVDCLEECLKYSRRICIFRVHSLGVVVLDAQVQQSIWLERTFYGIWFHDIGIHLLLSNRTCWGRALASVSHDKFHVKFPFFFSNRVRVPGALSTSRKRRGLPEFFRCLRAYWGLGGADVFFFGSWGFSHSLLVVTEVMDFMQSSFVRGTTVSEVQKRGMWWNHVAFT